MPACTWRSRRRPYQAGLGPRRGQVGTRDACGSAILAPKSLNSAPLRKQLPACVSSPFWCAPPAAGASGAAAFLSGGAARLLSVSRKRLGRRGGGGAFTAGRPGMATREVGECACANTQGRARRRTAKRCRRGATLIYVSPSRTVAARSHASLYKLLAPSHTTVPVHARGRRTIPAHMQARRGAGPPMHSVHDTYARGRDAFACAHYRTGVALRCRCPAPHAG